MATISGEWKLNDTLTFPSGAFSQDVNFMSSGFLCAKMRYGIESVGSSNYAFDFVTPQNGYVRVYYDKNDSYSSPAYQYVSFAGGEQEVSDTFYAWFTTNATRVTTSYGYALYNGVRLPKLPNGLLTQYPYVFIGLVQSKGSYQILASKTPMYFADNKITRPNNDTEPFLHCNADALIWRVGTSGNYHWDVDADRIIIWSNHDIPNGSATATDIYFKGTEPVPIEEEPDTAKTLITYNGNEIATLEAGQTAIFPEGKKATDEVTITFGANGSITYKGVTTEVEKGKTARLLFKGKKFGSDVVIALEEAEEEEANYLTFSSPSSFTLAVNNAKKNWNGTIEYSTDTSTWNVWDGETTLSADGGKLYLRGTGNTRLSYGTSSGRWALSGSNIACEGNIENLLDYVTVAKGEHPPMHEYCYQYLFYGAVSLISAPVLPATTLSRCCYYYMFGGCTNLQSLPALPATKLADECYCGMFYNCEKIKISTAQTEEYKTAYRIPVSGTATTATDCFNTMFAKTGGTFTDTPSINTTYYTSNEVVY